jgi:hypothetical protein
MNNDKKRELLRAFRNKYNLTQRGAAELLRHKYNNWKAYESGRVRVPDNLVRHIEHYHLARRLMYANENM